MGQGTDRHPPKAEARLLVEALRRGRRRRRSGAGAEGRRYRSRVGAEGRRCPSGPPSPARAAPNLHGSTDRAPGYERRPPRRRRLKWTSGRLLSGRVRDSEPGRRNRSRPVGRAGEDAGFSIRRSRVRLPHGVPPRGHGRDKGGRPGSRGARRSGRTGRAAGPSPRCSQVRVPPALPRRSGAARSARRSHKPQVVGSNPTSATDPAPSEPAERAVVSRAMPAGDGRRCDQGASARSSAPARRHGVRGVPERTPGRDPGREGSTPSDHPAGAWSWVRPSGCKPPAFAVQVRLLPPALPAAAIRCRARAFSRRGVRQAVRRG